MVTLCALVYVAVPGTIDGTCGCRTYDAVTMALGRRTGAHARSLSMVLRSITKDPPLTISGSFCVGAAPDVV